MTQIEMDFYRLACSFFGKFLKDKKEIDWESRKWDLVARMVSAREGASYGNSPIDSIDRILEDAETIINKYKENGNGEE